MENFKKGYAFVIDTNEYAGNFEREMCAHITGQIGECGVGEEYKQIGGRDFDGKIMEIPDDNGCYRPVSCCMNPEKTDNNSVAIFFNEQPTHEDIEYMKEQSYTFNEKRKMIDYWGKDSSIEILGFRLIQKTVDTTITNL